MASNKKYPRQRHCFVPGCTTGYRSRIKGETKKYSLFRVPNSKELLSVWTINIRRADKPLDIKCCVCEKHFEEKFISRDYVHIINGEEVRIPRFKPSLSKDAIPTIFPSYSLPSVENKMKVPKRAVKHSVLNNKRKESSKTQKKDCALSSCLKNEASANLLKPLANLVKNSTENWTNEETSNLVDCSTVSDQLEKINMAKTAARFSIADVKELKSNETQITINSGILHPMTEKNNFSKITAAPLLFDAQKRKYKGTQTKMSSSDISNKLTELKQMRVQLMKKHKDNESLRKKLQEKSDKLECFENNALLKNVAKMQVLYNEGLANKQIEFLLNQISNFEKKNPRWSDSVLQECMILRTTSSEGYDAFRNRELLRLPGRKTLHKFTQSINITNKLSNENCEL